MMEERKDLPENAAEIDTVTGDMKNTAPPKAEKNAQGTKRNISARTKKRLVAVAIATGALLLVLGILLAVIALVNNRPPKFEDVRANFEELLTKSQGINEMIWGAGLPVYSRVDAETQVFEMELKNEHGEPVKNKDGEVHKVKLRYYLYEDDVYGKVVSYEFQTRVAEGKTNEDGYVIYTVYDVESGGVLPEYKNGAARFAQRTTEPIEGKTPILQRNGYYYYALPGYENADLAASSILYSGKEDQHYDYVVPNATYRNTDDMKAAIAAVYANAFMAPLYESLFTGTVGAASDVHQAAYYDYIEEGTDREWLMKSNAGGAWKWREPLPVVEFDFATMQMTGGNAKKVTVSLNYRVAGEDTVKQMEVDFVRENGTWLLNTPTFG